MNLRSLGRLQMKPHLLEELLYTGRGQRNNVRCGGIITNSIAEWEKVEIMMGKTGLFHHISPLWNNYLLQSGREPFKFLPWLNKGVSILNVIFNNAGLLLSSAM